MNPCYSNPCKNTEECIQSNEAASNYVCVPNFCERMKPCNVNSECIYSKENNTFFCRCFNGASSCDELTTVDTNFETPKNIENIFKTMNDKVSFTSSSGDLADSSTILTSLSAELSTSLNVNNDDSSSSLTVEDSDAKAAQPDNKPQSDIPKIGFNLDNVFSILFKFLFFRF